MSNTPTPDSKDAFERAQAELDAIAEEAARLETEGKLDKAADRRINAELQSAFARLDQAAADRLRELRTPPKQAASTPNKFLAALILLGAAGALLELFLGDRFVFFFRDAHKSALPILIALMLPACAFLALRMEKRGLLTKRLQTKKNAFALFFLFFSAMLIFSPPGWSAAVAWAIGVPVQAQAATILSGPPYGKSRHCNREAVIDLDGIRSKVCLRGQINGPLPEIGDKISLYGRRSFLGFFIEKIRVE